MSEETNQEATNTENVEAEVDPIQAALDAAGVAPYRNFNPATGKYEDGDRPMVYRSTSAADLPQPEYDDDEDPIEAKEESEAEDAAETTTGGEEEAKVEEPSEPTQADSASAGGDQEADASPTGGMFASDWAAEFQAEQQKREAAEQEKQQAQQGMAREDQLLRELGELKGRLDTIQNQKPGDPEDWLQAQLKKQGATPQQAENAAAQAVREEMQAKFKELEEEKQRLAEEKQALEYQRIRDEYYGNVAKLVEEDERFGLVKVMGFQDEAKRLASQAAMHGTYLTEEQALSRIQKGLASEFQRIGEDETARAAILAAMGVELPSKDPESGAAKAGAKPNLSNNTGPALVDEDSDDPWEDLSDHERISKVAQQLRWTAADSD